MCPLSVRSAQPAKQRFAWDPWATLRRLGAERADPKQDGADAERRGWGGGEAVDHPAVVESRQTCLASMTLGAGLESWLHPPSAGSLSSGWKLPWLLFSRARAKGISCFSGLSSGPSEGTTSPILSCCCSIDMLDPISRTDHSWSSLRRPSLMGFWSRNYVEEPADLEAGGAGVRASCVPSAQLRGLPRGCGCRRGRPRGRRGRRGAFRAPAAAR